MNSILNEERFDFISTPDRAFILAFNAEMIRLGYSFGDKIGSGFCWGRYMLIYTKSGVKSKKVYTRIYIRDQSIVLRLFLNDIDQHRQYIETAPSYIKDVFTGTQAECRHDRQDPDGRCRFQKTYTIDGRFIEKCNGITFEFHQPSLEKLSDYIGLFLEFYPMKKSKGSID